jgi:hypothetical protein
MFLESGTCDADPASATQTQQPSINEDLLVPSKCPSEDNPETVLTNESNSEVASNCAAGGYHHDISNTLMDPWMLRRAWLMLFSSANDAPRRLAQSMIYSGKGPRCFIGD